MSAGGFDRQGSLIRQLQGALGGKAIVTGSTSPSLSGTSGTFTVTHTLGRTPIFCNATPDGAGANDLTIGVSAFTTTQFTVSWRRASGAATGFPVTFYWIVIG